MKTVRIENAAVAEIIPDDALPVAQWYGDSFASACVEAPDEVEQRWVYNSETAAFSPPTTPEEQPIDTLTQTQLAIAELAETQEANQTANELALAELAELITGGVS